MIKILEKKGDPQRLGDIAEFFDLPIKFLCEVLSSQREPKDLQEDYIEDRWFVEKVLDSGRIYGPSLAAAHLGITRDSLLAAVDNLKDHAIPIPAGDVFGTIFSEKVLDEWSSSFIKFVLGKHPIWANADFKARDLVAALKQAGVQARIEYCSFQKKYWKKMRIGEKEKAVAMELCAVTRKPVSSAYMAWLDNGKPMSLKPDYVSWQVLVDYPKFKHQVVPASLKGFDEFISKWGD